MNNQIRAAIVAIAVIIPLSGFAVWSSDNSGFAETADTSKIVALTSFYPLYEFTSQVGQSNVDISLLVPAGVEPHDWEPTIHDIERMQQADLVIINGIGFENWIDNIDEINSRALIVDTSKGVDIISSKDDEHSLGDPHIWLNPVMAKIQVQNIANSLIKVDPENKNLYQENANSYISKLDALDATIKDELKECKTDFIAFHKAFSYFAIQYGLNQHTIVKTNDPLAEPTSKTLEEIIKQAKQFETDVIFTEEGVDTRTSQVIANELDGQVLVLSPLEVNEDDSNYFAKMEQNLSNLKEALCK
ncbi:MAG: metal ABC transporter substrate-binding protein [Nitrosopumilaceae archaeon]